MQKIIQAVLLISLISNSIGCTENANKRNCAAEFKNCIKSMTEEVKQINKNKDNPSGELFSYQKRAIKYSCEESVKNCND